MSSKSRVIYIRPDLDEVLLTPKDLAKRLNYTEQSLANMRSQGRGPRFYRMANKDIRYPDWAVLEFEMGSPE